MRVMNGLLNFTTEETKLFFSGDCQLGSDNKSFLTGKYDDNRQTKRDGAYVMQGHNSWLLNLIVANCWDMIVEIMVSG